MHIKKTLRTAFFKAYRTFASPLSHEYICATELSEAERLYHGICLNEVRNKPTVSLSSVNFSTLDETEQVISAAIREYIKNEDRGKNYILTVKDGLFSAEYRTLHTKTGVLIADYSRYHTGKFRDHPALQLRPPFPIKKITGTCHLISCLGDQHFFVYLNDLLGMTLNLAEVMDLSAARAIRPNLCHDFEYTIEEAYLSKIPRIASPTTSPLIRADEIVAPSRPNLSVLDKDLIELKRQLFKESSSNTKAKRIYISRSGTGRRRLKNENELLAKISKFGFVKIDPDALSFLEQVRIFQSAESIIAEHGAALSNICFCNPKTSILEIVSEQYYRPSFLLTSYSAGLDYNSVFCEENTEMVTTSIENIDADITISRHKLDLIEKYCTTLQN